VVTNSNQLIVCVEVIQVLEEEEYTFNSRTCSITVHQATQQQSTSTSRWSKKFSAPNNLR